METWRGRRRAPGRGCPPGSLSSAAIQTAARWDSAIQIAANGPTPALWTVQAGPAMCRNASCRIIRTRSVNVRMC